MRKSIRWTIVPIATLAVACGRTDARKTSVMSDDLKADLQLASQAQRIQISPDEISPKAHRDLAVRPKKAINGPKVIRSERPTVKASALPVQVAETKTDIPQVQVMAASPAPAATPTSDAPPLARPSATPAQGRGAQGDDGSGSTLGGIFGAVIRGGVVGGDDDHCDPRPRGRTVGGDIAGMLGGMIMGGGMGSTRHGGRP